VGRTTVAVNLAAVAARPGVPTLLVDADPLGSVIAALNLPAHADRLRLHDAGVDSNAVLIRAPPAHLDMLALTLRATAPGHHALPDFRRLLDDGYFRDRYRWALLDGPAGAAGEAPRQLLRACDELLIVLRAEPLPYRTLPAYLRLVRQVQSEGAKFQTRGLLL